MRKRRAAIDFRSGTVKVNRRAVALATSIGLAVAVLLRWLVPGAWFYAVVVVLVVVGLGVDTWLVRTRGIESPDAAAD